METAIIVIVASRPGMRRTTISMAQTTANISIWLANVSGVVPMTTVAMAAMTMEIGRTNGIRPTCAASDSSE